MVQRLWLSPPVRFLFCGGLAAGVNWLGRIWLSQYMTFEAALVLAYVIGMVVGFALYKTIVWPGQGASLRAQVIGFVTVNAASALVVFGVALLMRALLHGVGVPEEIGDATAHAIGIALGAAANFLGHKSVTFRPAKG